MIAAGAALRGAARLMATSRGELLANVFVSFGVAVVDALAGTIGKQLPGCKPLLVPPRKRSFVGVADMRVLNGKCPCGATAYEVHDDFRYSFNCHCSNCRRATGAAFKSFAGIARDEFRVSRGIDQMLIYGEPSAHDAHCGICGSLLYSLVRNATFVHVTLGTLVDAPSIRPSAHIFVGSKAPWFTITDGLPQYQAHVT